MLTRTHYLAALGVCVCSILLTCYRSAWPKSLPAQRVSSIAWYQGTDGRIYFTHLPPAPPIQPRPRKAEDIPLHQDGGVYEVIAELNGILEERLILDTGAAEVHISSDAFLTLVIAGMIQGADFLSPRTYVLADGSLIRHERVLLRRLKIGNQVLTNVSASFGGAFSSSLLGQNALAQLEPWHIDSQQKVLHLGVRGRKRQSRPHAETEAAQLPTPGQGDSPKGKNKKGAPQLYRYQTSNGAILFSDKPR